VFTSGSTARPKLTGVRHEGWFNLMHWLEVEYGLHHGRNHLVVSAFGFDLSQRSLMTPLFVGATQHLMPSRNFDALMALPDASPPTRSAQVHCASTRCTCCGLGDRMRGTALTRLDHVLFGWGTAEVTPRSRTGPGARGTLAPCCTSTGVAECTDVATSYDLAAYRPEEQDVPPVGRPAIPTPAIHVVRRSDARRRAGRSMARSAISGTGWRGLPRRRWKPESERVSPRS